MKMVSLEESIYAGQLTKLHGTDGRLMLKNTETLPVEIEKTETVFILLDNLPVPFFVDGLELIDENTALIRFDDYTDRDKASRLKDAEVYVKGKAAGMKSNITRGLQTFVGYKAFVNEGQLLGTIRQVEEFEKNPMFILDTNDIMIPITDDFILSIDHEKKEISFDLPEGLLEL